METKAIEKERMSAKELLRKFSVLITVLVVIVFSAIASKGTFFQTSNLLNVGERASIIGIVAVGQTMVILTSGIDLSVGSTMAMAYSYVIIFHSMGMSFGTAVLLSLLISAVCGLINGILVVKTKIPPFLITLSMMMIEFAWAKTFIGNLQLRYADFREYINTAFGFGDIGSRMLPTVVWVVLSLLSAFVLARTRFGNNVYAVGGGAKAAFLSGVRSQVVTSAVYVISGITAGLAGIIFAYRVGQLMPDSSEVYNVYSMAAVVMGGTSFAGGEGNVFGSFLGSLVIAVLLNIMNILRVDAYFQYTILGLILMIVTFIISRLSNR